MYLSKNTKHERLLQLGRLDDTYILQIVVQIEQQRDFSDHNLKSDAKDVFAKERVETGYVSL